MTEPRNIEDRISLWLEEDAVRRFPDYLLKATYEQTRKTPQQTGWRRVLGTVTIPRFVPALGAAAVVLVAVALVGNFLANQQGIGGPDLDPRTPFIGTWLSHSDNDGGTQNLTTRRAGETNIDIVVTDDIAGVCGQTPSTMTGAGTVTGNQLIVPEPDYRCDDGREPRLMNGDAAAINELFRNYTLTYDAAADTLTVADTLFVRQPGLRPIPTPEPGATPAPPMSGAMWPQTSLEEARLAQESADAGDPDYTWQVNADLAKEEPDVDAYAQDGSGTVGRFLHDVLGWDAFFLEPGSADEDDGTDGEHSDVRFLRCDSGKTNPLYPGHPCAPTLDDLRYERVALDLTQPATLGATGIWVVSAWAMSAPFAQTDPGPSIVDVEGRLNQFLRARVDGAGADGYVNAFGSDAADDALMYATTDSAPYERFELERASGPEWPTAEMAYTLRLYAGGGATVVEQLVDIDSNRDVSLWVPGTTENGEPVPVTYNFFEDQVSVAAPLPWLLDDITYSVALQRTDDRDDRQGVDRIYLLNDPLPVGEGCAPGAPAAGAAELAEALQADPDLIVTAPASVTLAGRAGLSMDVTAASGASVCEDYPATYVLAYEIDGNGRSLPWTDGDQIRLYLLDAPSDSTLGILAIAVVAPESRFDEVFESARPILDTIEFHAP